MTADQLIEEGRRLQRPTLFLRPQASGEAAAIWHEPDDEEIDETGHRCWITVDARFIPGLSPSIKGYISIFTNEEDCRGGKIEVSDAKPIRRGIELYAYPASVIPPIDAVFARGSAAIDGWLRDNNWQRGWRYNNNFKDKETLQAYKEIWFRECPLYFKSDIHAVLGGWHFPGQDGDWHDLIDEHLMVLTLRDSEPWVEGWWMRDGKFKVMQRIT